MCKLEASKSLYQSVTEFTQTRGRFSAAYAALRSGPVAIGQTMWPRMLAKINSRYQFDQFRSDFQRCIIFCSHFQCTICSKTFKSARILRGHLNLHAERNFSCEICGKRFGRRYHVKVHMKIHEKRNETIVGLN